MNKKFVVTISMLISLMSVLNGCVDIDSNEGNVAEGDVDGDDVDTTIVLQVCASGEKEFTSIQDAIDAAAENSTIFVFPGLYEEQLIINKTITLRGEHSETTIIDGKNLGRVIEITHEGFCTITGFTIQKSGSNVAGIELKTSNNDIRNNIIKDMYIGINTAGASYNIIENNTFISNAMYGIYISSRSDHNSIKNNLFDDNLYGMRIKGSRFNLVEKNNFYNNRQGLYFCCAARDNSAFQNNFVNNSVYSILDDAGGNVLYNDKTNQGNYYDDYIENYPDAQQFNGIWDTPYDILGRGNNQDPYPLISPE